MIAPESLAMVIHGVTGPVATASRVLQADAAAVIVVIVILAFMVLLVVAGRRKPKITGEPEPVEKLAPPTKTAKVPASKETFEPLPEPAPAARPSPTPSIETPDEEVVPVDSAWELGDDDESAAKVEAARANEAEAAKKRAEAEDKKREADDKAKAAEAKKREAEEAKKRAEAEARTADDATAKAAAAKAAEEAKAAADAAKKAEQEARAEAARAAEARDKAVKEAAERAKAEAKAAAEAEAKAKAEARRKEQEHKAKAEAEAKAKADAEAKKAAPKAEDDEGGGPAKTLKDGLGRTRKEGFIAKLSSLFAGKQLDQDLLDEVEEALFTADIGVRTAERLLSAVREALSKKELKDASKVWDVLRAEAQKILEGANAGAKVGTPKPGEPFVTMVLGVNGTGKTTSIGKLAHKLLAEKKSVVLVAGDTFRAAATEQLEHWARRVGAPCIKGKEGADPASVVFDGVKQGLEQKADVVLVDTAGRLHNNTNLMEELKKVRRVMGRAIESAPHEVLMVLDATTGQNGITQAKLFKDATDVTGIILTKLDGTAKGGVVLGVCDELKIPIKWIGVGERVADLRAFDPREFVDELFAPPS